MQNVNLVGTWKLLSAIARNPNEDTVYPFGENPFGRLMYDTTMAMSLYSYLAIATYLGLTAIPKTRLV